MDYISDDGFEGTLTLNVSSIKIETAGTKKSSYTSTATRVYTNLSANDPSLVPKTITEGGNTFNLSDVTWQAGSIETVDYNELPASYTAEATYSRTGYKTTVTGYTVTADYCGVISKTEAGKTLYSAIFIGTPFPPPPEPTAEPEEAPVATASASPELASEPIPTQAPITPQSGPLDPLYFIIGGIVLLLIGGFVYIKFKKKGASSTVKTIVSALILAAVLLGTGTPAYSQNYSFTSGADASVFGASTSNPELIVAPNPETENVRRNKDAAYFPPSFGVFSGDIPTEPSSYYHDNSAPYSGTTGSAPSLAAASTPNGTIPDLPKVTVTMSAPLQPASAYTPPVINTAPLYYDNGTIGTLKVQKTGAVIKVFEGEGLDNLAKGGGHFSSTSAWDGNVCIAGHNRGSAGYFAFMKNLVTGDRLTYTTLYGARTYEVFDIEKISETDNSLLGYSANNILSLFTCVENVPGQRLVVVCRAV